MAINISTTKLMYVT